MSIDADRKRLSHHKNLEDLRQRPGLYEMMPVYLSDEKKDLYSHYIRCALVPSDQIDKVLSRSDRYRKDCKGMPGGVIYSDSNEEHREYLRYGTETGIEPLIIERYFYQIYPDYREISEEFRHFHNLYQNTKIDPPEYIKLEDDGNEHTVAIVETNLISIRLKEILQFASIKEMHLAIYFDYREYSNYSEEELQLDINEGSERFMRDDLMCWEQYYTCDIRSSSGTYLSVRRLIGKQLFKPLPKSKSGFWLFAEESEEKYTEFIIDVDENGDNITYTSNPNELKTPADPENIRGVDSDAPSYLTPVHFRKQVLDKYYQESSKYNVRESTLHCGGLWCMFIDDNHEDRVCAWLGDLGRDMPYSEQQHWLAHNIQPKGGVSQTYFQRQLMAQFTDSKQPEHMFKQKYRDLQKACEEHLGWQLLLPLEIGDEHHLERLRTSPTNEQHDFDELILSLTKILIDSLNEKALNKLIPASDREENPKGITRLDSALKTCNVVDGEDYITFLRQLQDLRSSGTVHRKGRKYIKAVQAFGIENLGLKMAFRKILLQAVDLLEYFIRAVNSGKLRTE